MKKWFLVVLLYALGGLFIYDVMHEFDWIRSLVMRISEWNDMIYAYIFLVLFIIPFIILLINYFVLRIRANNPAFTLINAIFLTALVIALMMGSYVNEYQDYENILQAFGDIELWKRLWGLFPAIFVLFGINIISGVVISEAKSKGAYLTGEFVYLLTGIVLVLTTSFMFL